MKKLIIALVALVLIGLSLYIKSLVTTDSKNSNNDIAEYEKVMDKLDTSNYMNIENSIQNSKDITIFFGRETCPDCRGAVKMIQQNKLNITNYHYYNTEQNKNSNKTKSEEILDKYKVKYVPTIIHFKDGKEISRYSVNKDDENYTHLIDFIQKNTLSDVN